MSGDSGIFDKKKLYPKELKENTSFRTWSERFISWVSMDDADIGRAFLRAGKRDQPLDVSGLTEVQARYSSALYGHLRALTEGFRKAAKIVRLVKGDTASRLGGALCSASTRRSQRFMRRSSSTTSPSAAGTWSSSWETFRLFWTISRVCLMTTRRRPAIPASEDDHYAVSTSSAPGVDTRHVDGRVPDLRRSVA